MSRCKAILARPPGCDHFVHGNRWSFAGRTTTGYLLASLRDVWVAIASPYWRFEISQDFSVPQLRGSSCRRFNDSTVQRFNTYRFDTHFDTISKSLLCNEAAL